MTLWGPPMLKFSRIITSSPTSGNETELSLVHSGLRKGRRGGEWRSSRHPLCIEMNNFKGCCVWGIWLLGWWYRSGWNDFIARTSEERPSAGAQVSARVHGPPHMTHVCGAHRAHFYSLIQTNINIYKCRTASTLLSCPILQQAVSISIIGLLRAYSVLPDSAASGACIIIALYSCQYPRSPHYAWNPTESTPPNTGDMLKIVTIYARKSTISTFSNARYMLKNLLYLRRQIYAICLKTHCIHVCKPMIYVRNRTASTPPNTSYMLENSLIFTFPNPRYMPEIVEHFP